MPATVMVQPPQPAEPGEERPLYTDLRSIGAGFWIAQAGGVGLAFGFALGFTVVLTLVAHGVYPTSQICECPSYHETFGPEAVFYDGCNDVESTWYQTFNEPPANETHQVKGWFGSVDWTRDTLHEFEITKAVTIEPETPPTVYECPVFRPFWQSPVDWVAIVILVVGYLGTAYSIATGTVRSTQVFADRVQVVWLFGSRTEVPLCALHEGTVPEKHSAAGLPPARDGALALKTTEIVEYADSECESGTSTRLTDDKSTYTVRVEPLDTEAFLNALDSARAAPELGPDGAFRREHIFADELPTVIEKDGGMDPESSYTYRPKHTIGYWLRVLPVLVLWWFVASFGFAIVVYAVKEVVQPTRAKKPDDFTRSVLAVGYDSLIFLGVVLIFGTVEYFIGVPSQVTVHKDAFLAQFERGRAIERMGLFGEQPVFTLAVPKHALVDVEQEGELDCFERVLRFPFQPMGGVFLKAKRFYVVKVKGKKTIVERKVAKKGEDSKSVQNSDGPETEIFYPDDCDRFVAALRVAGSSAESRSNEVP
eukprot:COSAG02_NODE_3523_length_6615_cov_49.626918_2_plen_537_part_00